MILDMQPRWWFIGLCKSACVFWSSPPVFGVRRSLLQPNESEAGRIEGQTADSVAPLLLGPEHRCKKSLWGSFNIQWLTADNHSVKVISLTSALTHGVGCNALLQLLPAVFDVFVDASGDEHGHQSVVPGGYEHQSQTQTHPEKRKSPDEWEHFK